MPLYELAHIPLWHSVAGVILHLFDTITDYDYHLTNFW